MEAQYPNWNIDLKSGKLHKHNPDDLICKSTSVGPEKMECNYWMRFLKLNFKDNEQLIGYLQRLWLCSDRFHL